MRRNAHAALDLAAPRGRPRARRSPARPRRAKCSASCGVRSTSTRARENACGSAAPAAPGRGTPRRGGWGRIWASRSTATWVLSSHVTPSCSPLAASRKTSRPKTRAVSPLRARGGPHVSTSTESYSALMVRLRALDGSVLTPDEAQRIRDAADARLFGDPDQIEISTRALDLLEDAGRGGAAVESHEQRAGRDAVRDRERRRDVMNARAGSAAGRTPSGRARAAGVSPPRGSSPVGVGLEQRRMDVRRAAHGRCVAERVRRPRGSPR